MNKSGNTTESYKIPKNIGKLLSDTRTIIDALPTIIHSPSSNHKRTSNRGNIMKSNSLYRKTQGTRKSGYHPTKSSAHDIPNTSDHSQATDSSPNPTIDWENEIARHIVSMYASTIAKSNFSANADNANAEFKSQAILGYVNAKEGEGDITLSPTKSSNKSNKQAVNIGMDDGVSHSSPSGRKHQSPSKNSTPSTLLHINTSYSKSQQSLQYHPSSSQGTGSTGSTHDSTNKLPAIVKTGNKFRSGLLVRQRDGSTRSIRYPPAVSPIWFVSAGEVRVIWEGLPLHESLQSQLDYLYEKKHYKDYLLVIEQVLRETCIHRRLTRAQAMTTSSSEEVTTDNNFDETIIKLWKQLISAANAFSILLIERLQFEDAHKILIATLSWTRSDAWPFSSNDQRSLQAYVNNSFAYYFYKQHIYASARSHTMKALEHHEACEDVEAVACCLLDLSCIQASTLKVKDAHKTLYKFLTIVEDGKLGLDQATPKHLCMVAIAYHNLAVVQLKLEVPDLACRSSQSARKISRLCLSYSSRWIAHFQHTHEAAVEDVKYLISKCGRQLDGERLGLLQQLVDDMYYQPTES